MRKFTTADRLRQLMTERGLKQVDIIRGSLPYQKKLGVKLGKSALSQYVNGVQIPDQHKLALLSLTLDVSEPWLMGYDVEQNRTANVENEVSSKPTAPPILTIYKQLHPPRQKKVLDFAKEQLNKQELSPFPSTKDTENGAYITAYIEGLVAAGHGIFQDDNLHMEVRLLEKETPKHYDTIAKVVGDSMTPLIEDNDLLFIKASNQVEINDIGIFQVNGKNFVKKLKRDYNGAWYLQSLNNSYEEIYLNETDDIRTIGEVVDIYKTKEN